MNPSKADPFATTADLIANAISSARVFGENPRIARLVASSVGRFAQELAKDTPSEGARLRGYALAQISEQDALFVPRLVSSLETLGTPGSPL
jgi:hypothetical protein